MGVLLQKMPKQHGARGVGKKVDSHHENPLEKLGIDHNQAFRCQHMATIPEGRFVHQLRPDLFERTLTEATQARLAVDPEAKQGARTDLEREEDFGKLPKCQSERAAENDVSPRTQRYLDHLARDRPDLLEQVEAGALKPYAAARQAGLVRIPTPQEILRRAWLKASAAEQDQFLVDVLSSDSDGIAVDVRRDGGSGWGRAPIPYLEPVVVHFRCPRCQTLLEAPDEHAGSKGACPCGQRLQVPTRAEPPPLPAQPSAVSSRAGCYLLAFIVALVLFIAGIATESRHHGFGSGGFIAALGFLIGFAVYIAVLIELVVWVARDARSRSMGEPALWLLLIVFLHLVGFIVFLACRPQGDLAPCPRCRNPKLPYIRLCPHCRELV